MIACVQLTQDWFAWLTMPTSSMSSTFCILDVCKQYHYDCHNVTI